MLDELNQQQIDRLLHAFNNGQTDYVVYKNDRFVGVNVSNLPNLIIEKEVNGWAKGYVSVGLDVQAKTP